MICVTGCGKNHIVDKKDNNKKIPNYERKVLNSTVNITTSSGDFGAGFIYDKSYIITNYHVVYQDNSVIKVTTYDRDEYNASLVAYEVNSDIAVLKIDKELESLLIDLICANLLNEEYYTLSPRKQAQELEKLKMIILRYIQKENDPYMLYVFDELYLKKHNISEITNDTNEQEKMIVMRNKILSKSQNIPSILIKKGCKI